MIQPLIQEVQKEGEYSLVFFNGTYSHAVLKTPKKGEYRTNFQFGSTEKLISPDVTLRKGAQRVLLALKETPLYARVDCIRINRNFCLMELEVIEPHLFLEEYPPGADLFAKSLKDRL